MVREHRQCAPAHYLCCVLGFILPHHTLIHNNIMIMVRCCCLHGAAACVGLHESWLQIFSLIAVIPISKYIGSTIANVAALADSWVLSGDAVGAIAARTSSVVGALLNGGLECTVELIVYTLALSAGMGELVKCAIVGTVD